MMNTVLLALLSASLSFEEEKTGAITSPNFYVLGFYFDDTTCETAPRPLSGVVRFDRPGSEKVLDKAEKLAESWDLTFNCLVKRERLRSCYLTDHGDRPTTGLATALRITQRLKITGMREGSPRAIVIISYDNGECPSWSCVATPAPVQPPPAGM